MIVTAKSSRFAIVLVTLTFLVTAKASAAAGPLDNDDREKVNVSNDVAPDEGEVTTKQSKLIRVPLYSIKRPRSIDTRDGTVNENERNAGVKPGRNAATSEQKSSHAGDISVNVLRGAKKNYKKLKMGQMQSRSLKKKEHSVGQDLDEVVDKQSTKKKIARRHVEHIGEAGSTFGNMNQIQAAGLYKHKDAEYYAQRQAVMDRFYARQREIARKYGNQLSTTARYDRYNLGVLEKDNNALPRVQVERENRYKQVGDVRNINSHDRFDRIPSTTEAQHLLRKPKRNLFDEPDDSAEGSEYDDEEEDEAESTTSQSAAESSGDAVTLSSAAVTDTSNSIYNWGKCKLGKLIYQHSLHVTVPGASVTETTLQASIEPDFCIDCVLVTSPVDTKAKVSIVLPVNNPVGSINLRIVALREERVALTVKVFVVRKVGGRCEGP